MSMRARVCFVLWPIGVSALCLQTIAVAQSPLPPSSLAGQLANLEARVNTAATGIPSSPADINSIAVAVGLEVSTAPIGTSTGGLRFINDPAAGVSRRSTRTFGPLFTQRGLTIGKGQFSAGFNALHANYDSLGGLSLSNGDLRFVQDARALDGTPFPVFYTTAKIALTSDILVGFLSYGVTDDLDIGFAVPWVTVSLGADVGLWAFGDVDITPGGHLLVLPRVRASGVGDVALFAKYRFWRRNEGGLAAAAEIRLPTGDKNELRGTGVTRTLASAIWSHGGTISPHANIGYEVWSSGVRFSAGVTVRDQIKYGFGLELQPHPRVTAIVDIIGRRLRGGGRARYREVPLGPGSAQELAYSGEALDVVSLAPGVKWNAAGNVLITGNVLLSITNGGIRANVTPVVGLDWAFGRPR